MIYHNYENVPDFNNGDRIQLKYDWISGDGRRIFERGEKGTIEEDEDHTSGTHFVKMDAYPEQFICVSAITMVKI